MVRTFCMRLEEEERRKKLRSVGCFVYFPMKQEHSYPIGLLICRSNGLMFYWEDIHISGEEDFYETRVILDEGDMIFKILNFEVS
jgi:hypothetical protein